MHIHAGSPREGAVRQMQSRNIKKNLLFPLEMKMQRSGARFVATGLLADNDRFIAG